MVNLGCLGNFLNCSQTTGINGFRFFFLYFCCLFIFSVCGWALWHGRVSAHVPTCHVTVSIVSTNQRPSFQAGHSSLEWVRIWNPSLASFKRALDCSLPACHVRVKQSIAEVHVGTEIQPRSSGRVELVPDLAVSPLSQEPLVLPVLLRLDCLFSTCLLLTTTWTMAWEKICFFHVYAPVSALHWWGWIWSQPCAHRLQFFTSFFSFLFVFIFSFHSFQFFFWFVCFLFCFFSWKTPMIMSVNSELYVSQESQSSLFDELTCCCFCRALLEVEEPVRPLPDWRASDSFWTNWRTCASSRSQVIEPPLSTVLTISWRSRNCLTRDAAF